MTDQVITSLGTKVRVVLGEPGTYNNNATTGFPSLSMVQVGEAVDVGDFGGESEVLTHTPIATGIVEKLIGPTDYGNMAVQMGKKMSDAGQTILKAGFDGVNKGKKHSFEVEYFDGSIEWFTGIITSFTSNVGSASNVRNGACNVALTNKVIYEPAPAE
jgi:hypothetical protein